MAAACVWGTRCVLEVHPEVPQELLPRKRWVLTTASAPHATGPRDVRCRCDTPLSSGDDPLLPRRGEVIKKRLGGLDPLGALLADPAIIGATV